MGRDKRPGKPMDSTGQFGGTGSQSSSHLFASLMATAAPIPTTRRTPTTTMAVVPPLSFACRSSCPTSCPPMNRAGLPVRPGPTSSPCPRSNEAVAVRVTRVSVKAGPLRGGTVRRSNPIRKVPPTNIEACAACLSALEANAASRTLATAGVPASEVIATSAASFFIATPVTGEWRKADSPGRRTAVNKGKGAASSGHGSPRRPPPTALYPRRAASAGAWSAS